MMNALEAILRRPKTVLTIMVVLLMAGISAYMTLPKEANPSIDAPFLYVSVSQSGVSPADANRLLVRPLEAELQDLEGLQSMRAVASTGHASVILEFDVNFDKDQALLDTKDRVDRAKSNLPDDATDPTTNEVSISEFGTITVALYGNVPERTLNNLARELKDDLESQGNIREVSMSGDREEVLEIIIDLMKLESYNLTTTQLFDALARNNLVVPAGTLDTGQGQFALEVPGLIETAQDVFNLPIKTEGDAVVTFSDVAVIQRTFKDANTFTQVNGEPALVLSVEKRLGANIIQVSDAVRAITAEHAENWPIAMQHSFILDQAKFAIDMFEGLQSSVLTAVALVLIVSIALLGLRPALLIGFAIPVSFMIGFFFLQVMGMTINTMIMFGLVLTVGMLVDGAIVIVEYAERKIAEGVDRQDAFIRAARMMFWPIVSSTGTTLAAFLPLLLWPGIVGKFMSYLPIMVIATLVASLIVAMVFLPVVGRFVARKKVSEKERAAALALSGSESFDANKIKGPIGLYVRLLAKFIRRPIISLTVGFALVVGVFYAFIANPTGIVAFPEQEPEFATVAVTSRGNYSPVEVRDLMVEVSSLVQPVGGIEDVMMNFGSEGAVAPVPSDTIGNLQLELKPFADRRMAADIFQEIRDVTSGVAGIGVELLGAENGPPTGKDISLRIEADTYEALNPTVTKVREYVENSLGDTIDIEDTRPLPGIDWEIKVDRDMAARFGIGVRELSPYVQLVTSGVELGTYRPDDAIDELEIRARLPKEERSFEALDSMRVITSAGLVPVSTFITREPVPKVADINRWDTKYYMEVRANVVDGVLGSEKVTALKEWVDTQEWPSEINFVFGGADEQTQETNAFLMQAGLGAMFLMFLILLTQFNSFYQVFITLSTVVMAVGGVLLGMLITQQAFSAIMTGVGIVALAGIVVNNSIVLIDTYNRFNRGQGIAPVQAMLMTAAQRIRPVLLTTITTVFGLIPMALSINIDFFARAVELNGISGGIWIQLSTALISGLTFSTLLTLVLVPVMITAPSVIWAGRVGGAARWVGQLIVALPRAVIGGIFSGATRAQPTPAVAADGVNSAEKYLDADTTGLVETKRNGVTVVSRQAAE